MDEEFDNLKLRNVWKLPPGKQLLGCRWVYNLKRDENGKVIRYKARLVAQEYSQVKGENHDETFSPVNFSVIRLFFSLLVVWLKWKHIQCDVTGAYLYAPLNEEVYMNQPQVKYANKPVLLADNQAAIDFLKSIENYCTKHIEVMRGGAFVNREKVNSLITFKIFDEWSNYLIGWQSRVSVTFHRVIESRQEGGDFRYDEYKKQDVIFQILFY
ncbi:retrovirus-related Pol polyprotein from transposon TNT 1-94 [Trichonephila clavipes]|uniref:Retrovirus-related Pol polyprotein from transposon TNT 1-94 n=1 Tax=Trichonephila clavipes TaxID=2585209 RepID=A0A8X6SEN5_TRICX|nr:retrovirus-related Pol polyprotein from transposon TNT 1-94 [Trichonephila clavipes]